MAVAYAAIANGGTVVTPTRGAARPGPQRPRGAGALAGPADAHGRRRRRLAAIREGLYLAANGPDGTSTSVFGNLPDDAQGGRQDRHRRAGRRGRGPLLVRRLRARTTTRASWWPWSSSAAAPAPNAAAPVVCRTMGANLGLRPRALCGQPTVAEPMTTIAPPRGAGASPSGCGRRSSASTGSCCSAVAAITHVQPVRGRQDHRGRRPGRPALLHRPPAPLHGHGRRR